MQRIIPTAILADRDVVIKALTLLNADAAIWAAPEEKGQGTMATGTIRSLRDRGFGFIAPDSQDGRGEELFFHHSAVADRGFEMLQVGQRVTFDVTPDPRDPSRRRAVNVTPDDEAEPE